MENHSPQSLPSETTIAGIFDTEFQFSIPPYQRAYAWEAAKDKQVPQFLDDLKEHPQVEGEIKSYFLGHFLFEGEESKKNELVVIDGQQRLTTVVIFFHCLCNELVTRKERGEPIQRLDGKEVDIDRLRQTYVIDHNERRKLQTVGYDDEFFRSMIIQCGAVTTPTTHSGHRLKEAMQYFADQMDVKKSTTAELIRWMGLVESAVITTFEVRSKEQATQIFAFQNDRGKDLTNLEKLKAYLMHVVYVHSAKSITHESIIGLERQFGDIYGLAEEIKQLDEDQVLSHHLMAFIGRTDDPVDLLKKELQKNVPVPARVNWIRSFCGMLVNSFRNVKKIEILIEGGNQHERLIGDVLYLNAPASWPLLLKLMHFHASELERTEKSLRLMEITLFKLAFMKGKSTNRLPDIANNYKGKLEDLERELQDVSQRGFQIWWDFNGEFRRFLESSYHYRNEVRYLLWKYENDVRAKNHGHHLSLREYLNDTPGQSLDNSIDHIMPQKPTTLVHPEVYKEQFLHNLGNLVLMTRSWNSSLKNKMPEEKAELLDMKSLYLTQQAVVKTIRECGWKEAEITARKKQIVQFAMDYWQVSPA